MDFDALYLDAAPLLDVLLDQLAFLVQQRSPACPSDCEDCARLRKIEALLLVPFLVKEKQKIFRMGST